MIVLEINLSLRRNKYRKRRNIFRRLFLFLFILSIFFIFFYFNSIAKKTPDIKIVLPQNHYVNEELLLKAVSENISGVNFFSTSTKSVSEFLKVNYPLFKQVVVRKYMIPSMRLVVVIQEKDIWGEVVDEISGKLRISYITDSGDLVSSKFLDLPPLSKSLIQVYPDKGCSFQPQTFLSLKMAVDKIKDVDFLIDKLSINRENELSIYQKESGLQVIAGKIDNGLLDRVGRLKESLNIISENSLMVKSLDLNLDSSAILKTYSDDEKAKNGIISKIMLN